MNNNHSTKSPFSLPNLPKLRFKGFDDEYQNFKINDLFEFISGLSGLDNQNFNNGTDRYIEYKEIYNKRKLYDDDGKLFNLNNSNQNQIITNDILITSTSETIEEIGFSSIYLGNKVKYLNSFCFAIRSLKNFIFPEYINCLFSNNIYRKKIISLGQGSTRINMSKNEFGKILINFPSLQEQQKIAKFFSLLDKQIELWETKLKLNEQIFNYLYNRKFNEIKNFKKVPFTSVFTEYSIKNIDGLDQYTIGKNGIKPINNPKNYDILNHKLFLKNSLVLGIGCNEISFNIDIKGSCSPIYKTFKLNNEYLFLNHYLYFFIKKYLNYRKQYFCKKSTRREWEIENNLLKKEYIPIMENISFVKMFQNIEKLCEWYSVKILELYKIKNYYLEQIII